MTRQRNEDEWVVGGYGSGGWVGGGDSADEASSGESRCREEYESGRGRERVD